MQWIIQDTGISAWFQALILTWELFPVFQEFELWTCQCWCHVYPISQHYHKRNWSTGTWNYHIMQSHDSICTVRAGYLHSWMRGEQKRELEWSRLLYSVWQEILLCSDHSTLAHTVLYSSTGQWRLTAQTMTMMTATTTCTDSTSWTVLPTAAQK